jgi:hypothetical protein
MTNNGLNCLNGKLSVSLSRNSTQYLSFTEVEAAVINLSIICQVFF